MGIGLSPVFSLRSVAQKCGAVRGMQALPGPWWRRERLIPSAGMAWGALCYMHRGGGADSGVPLVTCSIRLLAWFPPAAAFRLKLRTFRMPLFASVSRGDGRLS